MVFFHIGKTYMKLGQNENALDSFQSALKLNPNSSQIYNNMGLALYELSRFEDSLTCFNKSIELNPKSEKAYNNLGNLFNFDKHGASFHFTTITNLKSCCFGTKLYTCSGNFICLTLPTLEKAQLFESDMQKVGIFVKSQKGRMNEGVVRITIGRPEDNDRVLENLAI